MATIAGNILLLSSEEESKQINFKQIYSMDSKYINQALEMSQVFQQAIENTSEGLKFNFTKALELINKHSEMAVVSTINQEIQQSNDQVSVMLDKLVNLLKQVTGVVLPEVQTQQFASTIKEAFSNLNTQKDEAWIFWQKKEGHKTTYQYNILFAIQNQNTGSVIIALPISLTITVNLEKEKVLLITLKDKHDYEVKVQAIEVVEALKG